MLFVVLLAIVASPLAAAGRPETAAVPEDAVRLRLYVGEFTPRDRQPSDRRDPPSYLNVIIEQYRERHPNVVFEVLPEIGDGDAFLTWMTTQYLSANGPDIGHLLFSEVNRNAARPPETRAQFMEIQRTIKDAGYVPFAFHMADNPCQANWALRSLQDMLLDEKLPVIEGSGWPIARTTIEAEGVSQQALVAANRRRDYTALDPQWQEQLRLLKQWSAYWDPGWVAMNVDDAQRSFVTGRAAMMWHSSARGRLIENDTLRSFEYGTFSFPTVTRNDSPYASGIPAPAIGGAADLRVLWYVILPISMPVVFTVAVMSTLTFWNEYIWPLIVLSTRALWMITQGLVVFQHRYAGMAAWGPLFAGYVIASTPLVVLFSFSMKYFVAGLTSGAVKG